VTLPLAGVTVVSCEQAVAAPMATRHLADLGARVIKIERPGDGDFARDYDEKVRGMSSHFVWLNRSKESIALDLKDPSSREVMTRLLDRADIFVQNFAPGAAERLDLGASHIRRGRKRLITCSISGYGPNGPYSQSKAYDLLIQSESGLLTLTGTERDPAKCGIPVADISAGMYAFSGILTALYDRERSGEGAELQVSMFDCLLEWMGYPLYYTQYGGTPPKRAGTSHASIAPYGTFNVGDGGAFVIAVQNQREWRVFCDVVLLRDDLADDDRFSTMSRRNTNRELLESEIERIFAALSSATVEDRLQSAALAYARRRDVGEVLQHPQLGARHRWANVDSPVGPLQALLPPITGSDWETRMDPIPQLGEHTADILAWLGLDAADGSHDALPSSPSVIHERALDQRRPAKGVTTTSHRLSKGTQQ